MPQAYCIAWWGNLLTSSWLERPQHEHHKLCVKAHTLSRVCYAVEEWKGQSK